MSPQAAPKRPIRNIVLLSDGTGNSRSMMFRTNVWRIYEALDLADPAVPDVPRQFAYYDDGVGTSSFKPIALLGGALGFGLARNVRDLYGFLCRVYQPGDRIYAFGFSRGAFTIRVLLGLIHDQGVLKYDGDEAELLRLVKGAYRAYRKRYRLWFNYIGPLRIVRDAVLAGWAGLRGKPSYAKASAGNYRAVPIEFVGLWDTVAAYGMPVDELSVVWDAVVWPSQMPDMKLSKDVKHAAHALSLDDERNTFHPRLWHAGSECEDMSQVWFAGVHSDVGGGYADQGLSHVSLEWVAGKAAHLHLRFAKTIREQQRALSDENGPMNDSRHGLAGYYRYNPRRLEPLLAAAGGIPLRVHESVLRRIRVGQDGYAPIVLPREFEVQTIRGEIESGAAYLKIQPQQWEAYAAGREIAFNRVWWKRLIYFLTLFLTLALAALPLLFEATTEACSSVWCWASPGIRALDFLLPAATAGWTRWYALNPHWFYPLVLAILFGLWSGGVLQRTIGDAMRRVWYAIDSMRPSTLSRPPTPKPAKRRDRVVQALRLHPVYLAAFLLVRRWLLPGLFGLGLFGGLFVAVCVLSFAFLASSGSVCKESGRDAVGLADAGAQRTLDSANACAPTGLLLRAGEVYELEIHINRQADGKLVWDDAGNAADLRGVLPDHVTPLMKLATLLRREATQPWLAPMARIGGQGADLYALKPDPSAPLDTPLHVLRTTLTARTSGELFVYLNDAVGPPPWSDIFYRNNHGTAQVHIRPKPPAPALAAPAAQALSPLPASSAPAPG